MLQERIEGKWIASFRRFLALNGIGQGTPVAIVAETQSRPVIVQLAELACYELERGSRSSRCPLRSRPRPCRCAPQGPAMRSSTSGM